MASFLLYKMSTMTDYAKMDQCWPKPWSFRIIYTNHLKPAGGWLRFISWDWWFPLILTVIEIDNPLRKVKNKSWRRHLLKRYLSWTLSYEGFCNECVKDFAIFVEFNIVYLCVQWICFCNIPVCLLYQHICKIIYLHIELYYTMLYISFLFPHCGLFYVTHNL